MYVSSRFANDDPDTDGDRCMREPEHSIGSSVGDGGPSAAHEAQHSHYGDRGTTRFPTQYFQPYLYAVNCTPESFAQSLHCTRMYAPKMARFRTNSREGWMRHIHEYMRGADQHGCHT